MLAQVPIIQSLAVAADSHPFSNTSKRLGAFLTMSQFQVSVATSTMWATGESQHLVCTLQHKLVLRIATWKTPQLVDEACCSPFVLVTA